MATILIADDDPLLVELTTAYLVAAGHRVIAANDGREALSMVAEHKPDAVILDAMMPGYTGIEVLRYLRADMTTSKLPVMMLTARKQEDDVAAFVEAGANEFVAKPFKSGELVMRLEIMLRRAARSE